MTALTHIRLELARETGHPEGDHATGYDLYLPLTVDGHIDAVAWQAAKADCLVRKFTSDGQSAVGIIRHGPGGRWDFDYDDGASFGDEWGHRLDAERFVQGEYVSIRGPGDATHTYKVINLVPV